MQSFYKRKFPNWIAITFVTPVSASVLDALRDSTERNKWTPKIANLVMNMPIQSISD